MSKPATKAAGKIGQPKPAKAYTYLAPGVSKIGRSAGFRKRALKVLSICSHRALLLYFLLRASESHVESVCQLCCRLIDCILTLFLQFNQSNLLC
jgi:hypothetical protein